MTPEEHTRLDREAGLKLKWWLALLVRWTGWRWRDRTAVLRAIRDLGGTPTGREIRQEVQRATGRDLSYGALYVAIDRLEEAGEIATSTKPYEYGPQLRCGLTAIGRRLLRGDPTL